MKNLLSFMALALIFASGSEKENAGGTQDTGKAPQQNKDLEATAADTGEQSALEDQPTDNASGSTVPGTTGATHKIGDMLNLGPALPAHIASEAARRGSTLSEDWAAGRVPQETLGQPSHITVNEADLRQGQGVPPNVAAQQLDQPVEGTQPVATEQKAGATEPETTSKAVADDKAGKTDTKATSTKK